MTIDLTQIKNYFDATDVGRAIAEAQSEGGQINHVVTDPTTGESFVSHQGAPYERAHAWVEAMVNGTEYRDPGKMNPLKAKASEVSSMLKYLIGYYRKDLLQYPKIEEFCDWFTSMVRTPKSRALLRTRKTNYDRWDLILERAIELMDERL